MLPIAKWTPIEGFSCRNCGNRTVVQNPSDRGEWGCTQCRTVTHSLWLNFAPDGEGPGERREVNRARQSLAEEPAETFMGRPVVRSDDPKLKVGVPKFGPTTNHQENR